MSRKRAAVAAASAATVAFAATNNSNENNNNNNNNNNNRTMRAATFRDVGHPVRDVLEMRQDFPRPFFDPSAKACKGQALVRVRCCALAPGDARVLSGLTRELQAPKHTPFVPGGDLCGVVEMVAEGEEYLKVGDEVVAQFHQNWGALGEYAVIKTSNSERKPTGVSAAAAAATASSGAAATIISKHIQPGDRVLVIGGSGGVGTFLVQLARLRQASFVATTTTQTQLAESLGVDRAIDYTTQDVWTMPEFQTPEGQFDVIVDLVEFGWRRVQETKARPIIKDGAHGGRFLTTVPPIGHIFEGHSMFQMLSVFLCPVLSLQARTWLWRKGQPRYKFCLALGLDKDREPLRELLGLIEKGDVRVVLHDDKVFSLDEAGIVEAFETQASFHAHGKVVVEVTPPPAPPAASE